MRGEHRMKVCNGRMVTSFVLFSDWQDNGEGCCKGGQEKWSSPHGLSFMLYGIITEWWKLGSKRDISSWRSRSKQLKGRWKFSFKNTHSRLKCIDLVPLPSASKVISLIDSGRNTLFSCHRHHNGSLLRIYCTSRKRSGRNLKTIVRYIRNDKTQSDLRFTSVLKHFTLPKPEISVSHKHMTANYLDFMANFRELQISKPRAPIRQVRSKNDNLLSRELLQLGLE